MENLDRSIHREGTTKVYHLFESKAFKIFTLLCVNGLILLIMGIYFTYYFDEKSVILPIKKEIASQTTNKEMILDDTLKLFENISIYNLGLEKINYRNSAITTTLSHPKKATLLKFANFYKKRLKIRSIKFDEISTLYIAEVIIEY